MFRCSIGLLVTMTTASKKILFIEDDREIAELVAEELNDRGYEVHVAYGGQEGYSAILRISPDLVLSDLMMPAMSGFDILERLAATEPRFSDTPFIFLTGLTDSEVERKARELGADDLITKPVDFDVLDTLITSRLSLVAGAAGWSKALDMGQGILDVPARATRGFKRGAPIRPEDSIETTIGPFIQS
jgi:DNA-binding response OmpR family regulator